MTTKPCMGGFCEQRSRCAHFNAEPSADADERLCRTPDLESFQPNEPQKAFGAEKAAIVGHAIRLGAAPGGFLAADIVVLGCDVRSVRKFMTEMVKKGMLRTEPEAVYRGFAFRYRLTDKTDPIAAGVMPKPTAFEKLMPHIGARGITVAEAAEILGKVYETTRFTMANLVQRGMLLKARRNEHAIGGPVSRHFLTEEDRAAYLASAPLASDARPKKIPAEAVKTVAALRKEAPPKPVRAKVERVKVAKPKPERKQRTVDEEANAYAKAMKDAKAAEAQKKKAEALPPALRPGEPVFTEDTKREVRATPLPYRHCVEKLPEGGFSSRRIGEYTEPASRWVEAATA